MVDPTPLHQDALVLGQASAAATLATQRSGVNNTTDVDFVELGSTSDTSPSPEDLQPVLAFLEFDPEETALKVSTQLTQKTLSKKEEIEEQLAVVKAKKHQLFVNALAGIEHDVFQTIFGKEVPFPLSPKQKILLRTPYIFLHIIKPKLPVDKVVTPQGAKKIYRALQTEDFKGLSSWLNNLNNKNQTTAEGLLEETTSLLVFPKWAITQKYLPYLLSKKKELPKEGKPFIRVSNLWKTIAKEVNTNEAYIKVKAELIGLTKALEAEKRVLSKKEGLTHWQAERDLVLRALKKRRPDLVEPFILAVDIQLMKIAETSFLPSVIPIPSLNSVLDIGEIGERFHPRCISLYPA